MPLKNNFALKTNNSFAVCFDQPLAYAAALDMQERLVAARIAGNIPDVLLSLEHKSVITMGSRSTASHVLASVSELAARGIELIETSRGGDVTFHGPGQLVIYPILKLGGREADAHGHLANLEEIAIRTAADFGVTAFRRTGLTGAWTKFGKIAAIGIRFRKWVAFHGMSFNVAPDLTGFSLIVPCGLTGEPVTSLKQIMGVACPEIGIVMTRMLAHSRAVFHRDFVLRSAKDSKLPQALSAELAMAEA